MRDTAQTRPPFSVRPRRVATCATADEQNEISDVRVMPPDSGVQAPTAGLDPTWVPWTIDTSAEIYEGVYGPWQVTEQDVKEVWAYRSGIILAAVCSAIAFVGGQAGQDIFPAAAMNALCVLAALGFGTSLVLIHIYVSEIKQTMQFLFSTGVVAALVLGVMTASAEATSVPTYVAQHPISTLFVGPAFAAVTGVAIKEGLCYGKPEAGFLAAITPVWLLGHLSGSFSSQADSAAAGLFVLVFCTFAARKLSQAVEDDIGDGSVFLFRKLSEEDQLKLLRKQGKSPM